MSYLVHFVLVFFSTSLGEERANLSAFRMFVQFVLVWICRFPLPLGVCEGLRFVIVALPGLFSYLLYYYYSTYRSKAVTPVSVLLIVALRVILRGDLFYVLSCVILFLCFFVLLALRLPRLEKRELILMCFVRLFHLRSFALSVSSSSWFLGNRSPSQTPKGKQTNPNKRKLNKRTKNTKISSLFPKRGNRNAKRTEKEWQTQEQNNTR